VPRLRRLLRLVDRARGRRLQGLTGDAIMVRPTYVCTQADCGQGHAPLDAELGLGAETLMPRLARVVCRAGITGAFDEAAAQVREDHGIVLGTKRCAASPRRSARWRRRHSRRRSPARGGES